jgi:hypothetical protein
MRINRAIEKLRQYFVKRGVASTAGILVGAVSAHSVQAAPAMLAKTASAVAFTQGATASTSTLTLVKGALKVMAWTKAKTVIVAGVAVILAAGTTTWAVKQYQAGPASQSAQAAKYATPEATYQTWLSAMGKGDLKGFLACLTPDGQSSYMQTAGQGKSEKEITDMNIKIAGMLGDFQITSKQTVSADEIIVHFHSARLGNGSMPMQQVQGEWKISGNLNVGSNDHSH